MSSSPALNLSATRLSSLVVGTADELGQVSYRPGCAFAHQQRELRGAAEVVTEDAGLGRRFHSFAQHYVEYLVRSGKRYALRAALAIAGELALAPPRLDVRDVAELERLARVFLAGYTHHPQRAVRCEQRFAFSVPGLEPCDPDAAGPKATGILDRLELDDPDEPTTAWIEDYKSGPGAKFGAYNAYRHEQLRHYAWLATLAFPSLRLVHGSLWGVAYGPQNRAHAEWPAEVLDGLVMPRVAAGYVTGEREHQAAQQRQACHPADPGDWTARPHVQSCRFCQPAALGCPRLVEALAARGAMQNSHSGAAAPRERNDG